MSLRVKLIKAAKSTLDDSEIHGLGHLVKAKTNKRKLFWLICLLASITGLIYNIIISIFVYLQYKVITIDMLNYKTNSKFPAVDICNLNPYDGDLNQNLTQYILQTNNVSINNFVSSYDYIKRASYILKTNYENLSINKKLDLYSTGFNFKNMLISCKFQRKSCNENDFYYYHDYTYGNCFRFNGGLSNNASNSFKSKPIVYNYVKEPGSQYGLQLELYIGRATQNKYSNKKGIRVTVHHQNYEPFPVDNGVDVPVGYQTNLAITSTVSYKLANPYSNCLNNATIDWNSNEVLKFMINSFFFLTYSQQFCLNVCFSQFIFNACGCIDLRFKPANMSSFKPCTEVDDLNCITLNEAIFDQIYFKDCYVKCPIQCVRYKYYLQVSRATYPSKWYSAYLLNNTNFSSLIRSNNVSLSDWNSLKSSILLVNVFYSQMFYHNVTEEPNLTFDSIFSIIGGHLGLFLGMSILNFIEFFEIIFKVTDLILRQICFKKFNKINIYKLKKAINNEANK